MARLFKSTRERERGIWRRVVDLALTDVRVVVGGVDHQALEALEERLLACDFGVQATMRLVDHVESLARRGRVRGSGELRNALKEEVSRILAPAGESHLRTSEQGPTVYLVVGVNGVGKTTSVAKLARRIERQGKRALVAAADTFRAGAVEQLRQWCEPMGIDLVAGQRGGDPAAVAFDAIDAARARSIDVVLVDTAGRLHTHSGLMQELQKIDRVIRRRCKGAPHESLLVLDATVGQNAVSQVRTFGETVGLTGIILAKLDSTARGGIVVGLQQEFGLPVKLVGVGEGIDDMEAFDPGDFIEGVFEE